MRKDVKFGLTIGAILVVTLVVYVIVLSRGPATPQKIALALPGTADQSATAAPADQATDPTDTAHLDAPKTETSADADLPASPSANSPVPPSNTIAAPATQPAAAPAQTQVNTDWEGALNNGPSVAPTTLERASTPLIDTSTPVAHNGITRSAAVPLIDSMPSTPATQPSRPLMADIPTLDAQPAITPPAQMAAPAITPAPAYTPTATTAANTPRTHRVLSGESAYTISEAVYGSGRYYKKILAANPNVDPRHLRVGLILNIPQLGDSDKPASPAAANTSTAPVDGKTAYRVAPGDTLESIARKLYGTPRMMDSLYQANKGLIGADENVLKVGWTLHLPEAPTIAGADR